MLRLYDIDKIFDNKNVVIIIQVRTSSKDFKKIFKNFFEKPYILNIFKNFKNKYQLTVVATTVSKCDDKLVNLLKKIDFLILEEVRTILFKDLLIAVKIQRKI